MPHGSQSDVRPQSRRVLRSMTFALALCAILCTGIQPGVAEREPCLLLKSLRKPMQAIGTAKIAVIIVDFPGVPARYTAADVVSGLRDRQPGSPFSAFEVFSQSSQGRYQVDFGTRSNGQPAVFGPYLVDRSATTRCTKGYSEWSKHAAKFAASDGYKPKRYQHTVFLFPPRETIGCGVTGIGEVSGTTTWLFGLSANSFTHELGHNLGLFHSGRRDATGITAQYGDLSSPMGSFQPETPLFSAPHRSQLGWMSSAEQETFAAGSTGRRTLYALERQRAATVARVVSIPLPDGSSYKLSYRQELPEAPSSRSRSYVRGLTIHRDFGLGLTTRLMGILHDGETFVDEANNVKVTQAFHGEDTVTLDISGTVPISSADKGCFLVDPCTVTSESRTPQAMDCRGYLASASPYQFATTGRCPTRAVNEDYDMDGVADTAVQTADADGDGVPNEEDCNPTSSELFRLYRSTDGDGDGAYESVVPSNQGVCGSTTNPPGYLDEARLDSCPTVGDAQQTDNDRDGIGDVCQVSDPLATSRRRILPSLQQLSRSAALLKKLPSPSAKVLAKATSNAIKRVVVTFGSEPALGASTRTVLSKLASQLAKEGEEKVEANALSKALAPLGI
jgi:hypothetical protein